MALEDAIQNLADAINGYTAAISRPPLLIKDETAKPEPKKNVKATTAEVPAQAEPTNDAPAALAEDTTKPEEQPVDVNVLKEKFASLVEANREVAIGVLTKLGFSKLNLVPANKHAEALQLVEDALLVA